MPDLASIGDLMLTSLEKAEFYTLGAQDFMFALEDLQDWTVTGAQTTNTINGARGVPLAAIKSQKGVTGSMTNGVLSLPALAADVGGEVAYSDSVTIRWTDVVTMTSATSATINYTPAAGYIYLVALQNEDGTIGKRFTLAKGGTPEAGQYTINTKSLTFSADDSIPTNAKLVVKYDRSMSNAAVMTNPGDTFSKDATMIATFIGEDKACNQYLVQATFNKVSLDGAMTWGAGDEAKTYDLAWTAYANRCSGSANQFYSIVIVSDDDVDAAEA